MMARIETAAAGWQCRTIDIVLSPSSSPSSPSAVTLGVERPTPSFVQ
jgi:hypothetical protein